MQNKRKLFIVMTIVLRVWSKGIIKGTFSLFSYRVFSKAVDFLTIVFFYNWKVIWKVYQLIVFELFSMNRFLEKAKETIESRPQMDYPALTG